MFCLVSPLIYYRCEDGCTLLEHAEFLPYSFLFLMETIKLSSSLNSENPGCTLENVQGEKIYLGYLLRLQRLKLFYCLREKPSFPEKDTVKQTTILKIQKVFV